MNSSLTEIATGIKSFVDNVNKALSSSGFQTFVKKIGDLLEGLQEYSKQFGQVAHQCSLIMVELGWPPHENLYPSELIEIAHKYTTLGPSAIRKDVDNLFLKKFGSEELHSLLFQWEKKKWLKKRIVILRQAIDAHITGNYYLSVPALLPQIEGIIADGYSHRGKLKGKDLKNYATQLLTSKEFLSFDSAIHNFLFQIVLIEFEHGVTPQSFLSRHAILHGSDISYGTAANSLKCILLFDYLQNKFGVVSIAKGKTYHLLGCRVMNVNKSKRKVYESRNEAEKDGKKPCKLCQPTSFA